MRSEWIVRPTRKEVKEKVERGEHLNSRELFVLKSRSFVYPAEMLESLKGPDEFPKREIIEILYNWCREVDEAEDGRFPIADKIDVLNKLPFILCEIARRKAKDSLDDLIDGDLKYVTTKMANGAVDKDTQSFISEFGKGQVLKDTQKFSRPIKEIFRHYVGGMANGMQRCLEKRELETVADLNMYVHYVAELVGDALTSIVRETDNYSLLHERGKALAKILQITNITKNIRDDYNARADYPDSRILFLPREFYKPLTPADLFYSESKEAKSARENVFKGLKKLAGRSLPLAASYVLRIPNDKLPGYKALCLASLIPALENWKLMERVGPEAVFKGIENALKIDRDSWFRNIVDFIHEVIPNKKADSFLRQYIKSTKSYSFESGDKDNSYEKWSYNWIGGRKLEANSK